MQKDSGCTGISSEIINRMVNAAVLPGIWNRIRWFYDSVITIIDWEIFKRLFSTMMKRRRAIASHYGG